MTRHNGKRYRSLVIRLAVTFVVALQAIVGLAEEPVDEGSPPRAEATRLALVAQSLAPGEFARLATELPAPVSSLRDLLHVPFPDGRALAIHGWSDTGHWDPQRQKLFYLGMRRFKKFIAYDAHSNTWSELGWKGDPPPTDEKVGHAYGRNALDRKKGHYYHLAVVNRRARGLFRYIIDEDRWERLPDLPSSGYPSVAALSIEWHPGLDVLVVLDPSNPGRRVWTFDRAKWNELPRSTVNGYHSHLQYNDVAGDVLLAGGNRSRHAMQLLDRQGILQTLPDAPFPMTIGVNDLTYDPQSGRYLYIRARAREIWELDRQTSRWRRVVSPASDSWPTRSGSLGVPIPIESLGVIFMLHEDGPFLYRHNHTKCEKTSCPTTTK